MTTSRELRCDTIGRISQEPTAPADVSIPVPFPARLARLHGCTRTEIGLRTSSHGLVITGVGDPGKLTYKRSRRCNAEIDRAVSAHPLHCATSSQVVDFSPYGYDERQYCSPGFNLSVRRIGRTPHGEYPQYHTSADNLDFISKEALRGSLEVVLHVMEVLEQNGCYWNQAPFGEPQLGRRGLYGAVGAIPSSQ